LAIAFAVLLVFLFALPLFCLRILLRGKWRDQLETEDFLTRYGVLTLPFRDQYYWWEFVNVCRRAVLIIIIDFGHSNTSPSLQLAIAFAVLLVFLFAQVLVSPYKLNVHNHLAFTWIGVLLFAVVTAVLFDTEIQSVPPQSTVNQVPPAILAELGIDTSGELTTEEVTLYSAFIITSLILVGILTVISMVYEYRVGLQQQSQQAGIGYDFDGIAYEKRLIADLFPDSAIHLWRRARKFNPESRKKWLTDLHGLHDHFFPNDKGPPRKSQWKSPLPKSPQD